MRYISSPDRRWKSTRIEKIKRYLTGMSKNLELVDTDSRETIVSLTGCLPGGALSMLMDCTVGMIQ